MVIECVDRVLLRGHASRICIVRVSILPSSTASHLESMVIECVDRVLLRGHASRICIVRVAILPSSTASHLSNNASMRARLHTKNDRKVRCGEFNRLRGVKMVWSIVFNMGMGTLRAC